MNNALNKNFIHEFDYKDLYKIKKKSRLNSSFKVLKIRNCQSVKCLVNSSIQGGIGFDIKQTSHLFLICVELLQDISTFNEEDIKLLQSLTDDERPLVIQLTSSTVNNQPPLIYYKDDDDINLRKVTNIQPITWENFNSRMNFDGTSKFELLLQALASTWFGRFSGNLLESELNQNIDKKIMLGFTKSSSLCIRTMDLFNYEPEIILKNYHVYSCLQYSGAGKLLAVLDFPFNVNDEKYTTKKKVTINNVNNCHKFLLNASIEKDNPDAVKYVVKCFNFNDLDFPCNKAFENERYKAFVELIDAGAQYPECFNLDLINDSTATEKLHRIISEREEFHKNISSGTMGKVKDYVKTSSNLKTVFNTSNKSALTIALESHRFQIFSFLQSKGFSKEGDAHFTRIWDGLSQDQLAEIREANKEFFPEVGTHLVALLSRSRLSIGTCEGDNDCFKIIRMMYEELNAVEEIQPILKAIAFSEQLNVVFDFNQTSVSEMDPTKKAVRGEVRGRSYHDSGYIYVAAKNYKEEFYDIIGTLVHEMTHYAMNLVYGNGCKPYHANDDVNMAKYQDILRKTRQVNSAMLARKQLEPIINNVFGYAESVWEVELIVRVPHLLARYKKDEEATEFHKRTFEELFNFYSCKVLDDLKNCEEIEELKNLISEINQSDSLLNLIKYENDNFKRKFEVEFNQENEVNVVSSNVPIMTLTTIYKSLEANSKSRNIYLKVESIASNEKLKEKIKIVFNSVLEPKVIIDCTNKFKDYSEQLKTFMANFEVKNRFVTLVSTKETYAIRRQESLTRIQTFKHSWKEIEEIYRDKLMNSASIIFQSHPVILSEILEKDSEAMNEIPVKNLLASEDLKVDEQQHNIYFVDRKFLVKTRKEMSSSVPIEIDQEPSPSTSKQQNLQIEHATKTIRKRKLEEESEVNIGEEYEFLKKSMDEMIIYGNEKRVVLISDKAGTGKTFVLKEIGKVLKERNKSYWISFIDLKLHVKALAKADVNVSFDKFVASSFYGIKTSFEQKLFLHLYQQGKAILLLDGFDEISPTYKDTLMQVLKTFNSKSGNQLWITTRTHLEQDLEKCLHQTSCELLPFTIDEQIKYLTDFWTSTNENISYRTRNINMANLLIEKFVSLSSDNNLVVGVPLILSMLRKVYKNRELASSASQTANVYVIYEQFVQILMKEWEKNKGELADKDRDEVYMSDVTYLRIHENLAIKHLFNPRRMRIDVSYDKKEWNMNKLCRIGIYQFKNKAGSFFHETFAEFLVARCCIYMSLRKKGIDLEKGVKLLTEILLPEKYKILRKFLEQALESSKPNKFQSKILTNNLSTALKKHFECNENHDLLLFNLFDEQCENLLNLLSKVFGAELMKKWFSVEKRYPGESYANLNLIQHVAISGNARMISIFFELLKVMDSNDQHCFLVELNEEGYNIFHLALKNWKNENAFATVFENMKRILSKDEMKTLMQKKDSNQNNMFHLMFHLESESSIEEILKLVTEYLTKEQIKSMINAKNKNDSTCFLEALACNNKEKIWFSRYSKEVFSFFKFVTETLSKEEMNNLLQQCDSNQNNVFHLMFLLKSESSIEEVLKLVTEYLTKEQINIMMNAKNKNGLTCFLEAFACNNKEVFSSLCKFVTETLSKEEMNNLLQQCDSNQNNVFHLMFLLRSESSIEEVLKLVTEYLTKEQINIMMNAKNKNGLTCFLEALARNREVFSFFCKFVTETLGKEEMNNLLQQCDSNQNNVFHLMFRLESESSIEEVLKLVTEYLTKEQINIMMNAKNKNGLTCFLEALARNREVFSFFCKFVTETLGKEEMNNLLQQCDSNQNNVFHLMFRLKSESSIEEVLKLVTEYLTKDQIKSMINAKNKNGSTCFLVALACNNKEVFSSLCKFVTETLSKEEMNNLLQQCDSNQNNVFHRMFLLRSESSIEEVLKLVTEYLTKEQINIMMNAKNKNGLTCFLEALARNREVFSFFCKFVTETLGKEEMNNLLQQCDSNQNNVFHLMFLLRSESSIEEVLKLVTEYLTKEQINIMMNAKNKNGLTCFLEALARNREVFSFFCKFVTETLGKEEMNNLLQQCDSNQNNVFHLMFRLKSESSIEEVLKLVTEYLTKDQIKSMINAKNKNGSTCFLVALACNNKEVFSSLCKFVTETLSKEEMNNLLQQCDSNQNNVFHLMFLLRSESSIEEVLKLVTEYLTKEQINIMMNAKNKNGSTCFLVALACNNKEVFSSLCKFVTKTLDKEEMNNFLQQCDSNQNNVFHLMFRLKSESLIEEVLKLVTEYLTKDQIKSMINAKNKNGSTCFLEVFALKSKEVFSYFCKFVAETLSKEEMNNLLQQCDSNQNNVFHLMFDWENEYLSLDLIEEALKLVTEYLTKDKIKSMINAKNKNGSTCFLEVFALKSKEVFSYFCKFVAETLSKEEMNNLLQQCDSNQNNVFHLMFQFESESSIEEVLKLVTEYLTKEQIKSMINAKNKDCNNFIQIAIHHEISLKTITDKVLTFNLTKSEFEGLLFDENIEGENFIFLTICLRKKSDVEHLFQVIDNILKNKGTKAIISRFKGKNIFHAAARNRYNDQIISTLWQFLNVSFKEETKKLLMQTFADNESNIFTLLADFSNGRAMKEVFAIIKDCFTYEEAKTFLTLRTSHGTSCLLQACSSGNSDYIQSMVENIVEILKPEDQKTLIEFCDNDGDNVFHCAAGNQDNDQIIPTLWRFLNVSFKEETKKLLMQTSADNESNIFTLLAYFSNEKAMKEVFAIIKESFTYEEAKTFLTFRSSHGTSCLLQACSRGNSDYIQSMVENIVEILKPEDQKTLIEFCDNDDDNVFHCAVHDNPNVIVDTLYQNLQKVTSIDLSQLLEQKNLIQLNPLQYLFTARDGKFLEDFFNAFNNEETNKFLQFEPEPNLFQIAAISNRNPNIFESFHKILSEELSFSADEVKAMLLAVDKNGKNTFQLAVEFNTEEVCQEIWEIVRKTFTFVEQRQLMNSVGSENIEIAFEIIKILGNEEEIANIMQVIEGFFNLV